LPPQITQAIEAQLSYSVLSRIAKGETDPEAVTWVFSALILCFFAFAALLMWRVLMIDRKIDRLKAEVDSSDDLPNVRDECQ
jgi:hypothetical protein